MNQKNIFWVSQLHVSVKQNLEIFWTYDNQNAIRDSCSVGQELSKNVFQVKIHQLWKFHRFYGIFYRRNFSKLINYWRYIHSDLLNGFGAPQNHTKVVKQSFLAQKMTKLAICRRYLVYNLFICLLFSTLLPDLGFLSN